MPGNLPRGKALLMVGDLPLGAYHASTADAIKQRDWHAQGRRHRCRQARRWRRFRAGGRGGGEVGSRSWPISADAATGVKLGGFKVQGKSADDRRAVVNDALA